LQEYGKEYFDLDFENPYMLYLGTTQKDNLQAITHVDGTCRAQTVNESFDYAFRKLLEVFHELSGCPLLLNTSLNEAGKPIAGWIENAMNLFKSTDIDVLVVGNTIYKKQNV
jgi:carbamoyltransferase